MVVFVDEFDDSIRRGAPEDLCIVGTMQVDPADNRICVEELFDTRLARVYESVVTFELVKLFGEAGHGVIEQLRLFEILAMLSS